MNVAASTWSATGQFLDFERLVSDYYEALRNFALRLAGNPEVAGDLTQQTFYLALKHQHSLRDSSRVRSWLHSILHREFLQRVRKDSRHPIQSLEDCESVEPMLTIEHVENLDQKSVMDALLQLEEPFRTPLVLFYIEDCSYREIAASLKIPVGTVMSRLSRGKRMLRERLSDTITE